MNYRERMAAQNRKALAEQRRELEPWVIAVALNVGDGLYDDENEWNDDLSLKENLFEWIPFNEEDFREYLYAILEESYDERIMRQWSGLPLGVYLEMIAVGIPDDAMTPYPPSVHGEEGCEDAGCPMHGIEAMPDRWAEDA